MPKSISLYAAETDSDFFLMHTFYIADIMSSVHSPLTEPQMKVLAGTLNALLKARNRDAVTLSCCDARKQLC